VKQSLIIRLKVVQPKLKLQIRSMRLQTPMKEKVDTKIRVIMDTIRETTKEAIIKKEKKATKRDNTNLSILPKSLKKSLNKIMTLILR
jgi:hypothetical protein